MFQISLSYIQIHVVFEDLNLFRINKTDGPKAWETASNNFSLTAAELYSRY